MDLTIVGTELNEVQLLGPSLSFDEVFFININNPFTFSQAGTLDAGTYNVLIDIENSGASEGITGSFDLDFQIATVPEPSSIALLGFVSIAGFVRPRK